MELLPMNLELTLWSIYVRPVTLVMGRAQMGSVTKGGAQVELLITVLDMTQKDKYVHPVMIFTCFKTTGHVITGYFGIIGGMDHQNIKVE